MDEYEANYSRVEEIINAAQSIKDHLTCRICLELFKEPVTIKCGHKFCRSCILRVASNDNATCPFCNIKIQKRSIPKEGNKQLELCVDRFNALTVAINSDSGIDVLQPCNKVKSTKESAPIHDKPSTSKAGDTSFVSKKSVLLSQRSLQSKVGSQSKKRLSLRKKQTDTILRSSQEKNTLDKYLKSKSDDAPDEAAVTQEKVQSWLENITPLTADSANSDFNSEITSDIKTPTDDSKTRKSRYHYSLRKELKESDVSPSFETSQSTGDSKESKVDSNDETNDKNEKTNCKETQMRIQEMEMNTRRKKLNHSLPDKPILKTPSSVPVASHSDAYNWRRVKRVGKEMQVKTFKSLNVSIEKNSSSIVLDDTVPCNSIINDSKNVSRRSDINNSVSNEPSISKTKQKLSKVVKQKMESPEKITEECNYNQTTMDTSSLQNQNVSLSSIDEKRVNEIIGFVPDNLKTPEKTRDVQNVLNHQSTENLHQLSPLETNSDQVKDVSDDESSNLGSKTLVSNNQSSPKRKLSLKKKLTASINSKSIRSQSGTPDRISQVANESPRNLSPDKPKSRLSLRLPTTKTNEHSLNQLRSPVKNRISESSSNQMMSPLKNQINSSKSCDSSIRSVIVFKKLGRICRKRKHVPFLQLGKMIPKEVCKVDLSKIKIKSIEHTHIDIKSFLPNTDLNETNGTVPNIVTVDKNIKMLSPEKDSQLKFLSTESPHQIISKPSIYEADKLEVPMDIDESLPVVNKISKRQLDFQDVESNLNCDNDTLKNENISKQEHQEPGPTKSNQETIIHKNMADTADEQQISTVIISGANKDAAEEQKISSVITSEVAKAPNMPDISQLDFMENEICINNNNFENLQINTKLSIDEEVTDRIQEDIISISSINSESENIKNLDVEKSVDKKSTGSNINNEHTNSEVENDSDSDIYVPTVQKVIDNVKPSSKFEIVESSSTSSLSSLKTSPFKKKRSHSESSNDDDSVSLIIDKWCVKSEEPVIKKPKVITNAENNSSSLKNKNKSKFSDDFLQDDDDKTLVNEVFEPPEVNEPQSDPPIDDIIKKVKSFREGEASASNLIAIPSSLMSADLFESNEPNMQHGVQTSSKNQITSDHSSVSTWSPNGKTKEEKENLNASPDYSDITMMDLIQFNNKKPSSLSESSDGSDKENNMSDQIPMKPTLAKTVDNTEDRVDVIETSQQEKPKVKSHTANEQSDPYHISDSLMNITQEQLALKRIEKELIGVDLSTIQNSENNEVHPINEFSTPRRKRDDDSEIDSIDATPTAKRRQIYKFSSKTIAKSDMNTSQMSPEKNISLIPAVTPMRNTKSYPLSHSTPMTNTQENKSGIQTKKITLICSGLCAEHVKIVQNFARKFGGTFQNNFNMDVTHVIVQTDPNTKAGQKTFKYIQGIAFKKYLVSFQWVTDCLKQNTLLNEDDEKYEVLDPEILEPGSKRSRTRTQDLFEGFAFFCLEPFSSFLLTDFQDLLLHNGAMIVKTVKELSLQEEKLRIIILESENLSKNKVAMLKKSGVLVSFEWVVDSISQYQNLSLFPYLYATTAEEAAALGFPLEYLVDEETVDEEEEGEEG